ncbi:MAG TPA: ester cyclase [Chloroflexota bacterium]|nr:ester cyclase [Chloroflexota bacterium]
METMLPERQPLTPDTDAAACKGLVRRVVEEAVNGGNLAVLAELLAPDIHGGVPGVHGAPDVQELLRVYREAVPDARWIIEEQFADGHMVVTNLVATGTQRGPLWGLPATGKRMAVAGTLFCACANGKITEQRLQLDVLGLLQQLGVMPELSLEHEVLVARVAQQNAAAYRNRDTQE